MRQRFRHGVRHLSDERVVARNLTVKEHDAGDADGAADGAGVGVQIRGDDLADEKVPFSLPFPLVSKVCAAAGIASPAEKTARNMRI